METHPSFQAHIYDPEIFYLIESATHIPCLIYVIQLSIKALFLTVKVNTENNKIIV